MSQGSPLVLLDRDGVLNALVVDPEHGTVDSPLHPSQVRLLPGVAEALGRLTRAGFVLRIVSNQPAAAKGKTTQANLESVHAKVVEAVQAEGAVIASSHLCRHRAEDNCSCRKPRTGLLEQALEAHGKPAAGQVWMVGDGLNDIQAGAALGLQTALIAARKPDVANLLAEHHLFPSLWLETLRAFVDQLTNPRASASGSGSDDFVRRFFVETVALVQALDAAAVERVASGLAAVRERGGRLFILGVGGSAGHASHAVNDFRKLCGIEAYAPTDNVSELTARTNDEGWETVFAAWLSVSRLSAKDALLVFSVGGGSREKNVSANLVHAIDRARESGAPVFGIVGRDGGHTARCAEAAVVIPPLFPDRITPHTEGLCAVVWHLLVSHPRLQKVTTKWEAVAAPASTQRSNLV
jgi:D-sedoheptulose 7-phosphate isomerase